MFSDINSVLSKATKHSGIRGELKTGECIRMFQEEANRCLGGELAEKVKPLYIKDAIITIASLSERAIEELNQREEEILSRINRSMGEIFVSKIRYLA